MKKILHLIFYVTVLTATLCPAQEDSDSAVAPSGQEPDSTPPVPVVAAIPLPAPPAYLTADIRAAVYKIFSDDGTGSGFLADRNGLVITNEHVVHSGSNIRVLVNDSTKVPARLVKRDAFRDIALLRINPAFCKRTTPLGLADGSRCRIGDRVAAVGFPLFMDQSLTQGNITVVDSPAIYTDLIILPGNSGGPLLNEEGRVVGITTFGVGKNKSEYAGCISVASVKPLLEDARAGVDRDSIPGTGLLPVNRTAPYPPAQLRRLASQNPFPAASYKSGIPYGYKVTVVTPPYAYYREFEVELKHYADPFSDLHQWRYLYDEQVAIIFTGISRPHDFVLLRNGQRIPATRRSFSRHRGTKQGFLTQTVSENINYTGVFTYPADIFMPDSTGHRPKISWGIANSQQSKPIMRSMPRRIHSRIVSDFTYLEGDTIPRNREFRKPSREMLIISGVIGLLLIVAGIM